MRIDAVSIFPEYLAALDLSLVGKARKGGLLDLRVHDLRDWTHDRHRTVDDTPYGGGAGMVMRPEPWGEAIDAIVPAGPSGLPRLIVPTPAGRPFDQTVAIELAAEPWLVFACGRYEGIDARVAEEAATRLRVDEISIGDYVLNGGEVAVLVIVEAVARLLPGVIGNPESLTEESHTAGLLEYPVYTKPATWRGRDVPAVLTSGDHGAIARWRQEESVRRTAERRPDLLARWAAGGSEQARAGVRFEPAAEQDAGELVSLRHAARTGSAGTVVGEAGTVGGEAGTVGGEAGSVGGDAGTVGRDAGTGGGEAGSVGGEIADLAGRIGRGEVWKAMAGGRIIAAAAAVRAEQPVLSVEWVVVAPDRQDEERSVAAFLLDSVERAAGPEIRTFEAVARTEAELRLFRGAGYRPEPGAADPVRLSKHRRRRR